MRALDCKDEAHDDVHFTAEDDEGLVEQVRRHISEQHPDMSEDQARDIVAQGAYDE